MRIRHLRFFHLYGEETRKPKTDNQKPRNQKGRRPLPLIASPANCGLFLHGISTTDSESAHKSDRIYNYHLVLLLLKAQTDFWTLRLDLHQRNRVLQALA